ncbi:MULTISPECIES: GNAT family N-acetyltransferase [Bacillus]|uniref:GNAT family N-acetyltransferase n=1 Tax=Bacillus thuringiensis serovar sooncheon TaxID=180891 RepID=A0A9Q5SMW0_BACTU|nr:MULTISPECIES: GNAT family N-acetyltransferase [Bacillus]MDC7975297.1 GNAT family N-acetyltransferase [Bacillus sp. BLCC-B18]OTW72612.1 GNAT family N-acetyltransferase [Bacillus thuringiensis serovar coreanensis]OTX49668.1 GNAT family N-acetyltransferase [Bacillus thuringiensis serovar sooncheon]OTX57155.1 GNAT family N-acetyltransferase [Bacillus thuringiensis serovar guiyangiensis]OTX72001.1 GNAT family N-acetyltransferase [Bacillus thuringiensis serovar roskildiensis]
MGEESLTKLFKIDCGDIYLQEFTVKDAESINKIANQPEIEKFLPDWKSTKEQRVIWVTNYEIPENKAFLNAIKTKANIDDHILRLGIFKKMTSEFIGWCCTSLKDELPAPNREIMYAVSSEYHNNGYATKATKGLIDYLFENTNVDVLNAIALIINVPSNKVIEKCGFVYLSQQTIKNQIYNHYVLSKSEWIKNSAL